MPILSQINSFASAFYLKMFHSAQIHASYHSNLMTLVMALGDKEDFFSVSCTTAMSW